MKKFKNLIPITIIDIKEIYTDDNKKVIKFFILFKNSNLGTKKNKEKHWVENLDILGD